MKIGMLGLVLGFWIVKSEISIYSKKNDPLKTVVGN